MSVDDLFKELEPPRGGAERVARRLAAATSVSDAPRRRGVAWAAAAAVAAVATAVVLVSRHPSDSELAPIADLQRVPNIYDSPAFDRLLGRPLQTAELTATVDQQPSTLTELESQNAKVRIYRIN
jgi:hypothetical protein